MILVIDNFDSFVFNLARYCRRLGHQVQVVRNNQITVDEILAQPPAAIVLSPGPCAPEQAGISLELVRRAAGIIPILGVCLGHQTIAQAFGAQIVRSPEPMHGRSSLIHHGGQGVFRGLPDPLVVGRYHSLVAATEPWPESLQITATSESGLVMAIEHREFPMVGFQFHPESILTVAGYDLLAATFKKFQISPASGAVALNRAGQPSDTISSEAFSSEALERLWRSETTREIGARLDASRSGVERPASVFGGSWSDVGEPLVPEPLELTDSDSSDGSCRFPMPGADGWR